MLLATPYPFAVAKQLWPALISFKAGLCLQEQNKQTFVWNTTPQPFLKCDNKDSFYHFTIRHQANALQAYSSKNSLIQTIQMIQMMIQMIQMMIQMIQMMIQMIQMMIQMIQMMIQMIQMMIKMIQMMIQMMIKMIQMMIQMNQMIHTI